MYEVYTIITPVQNITRHVTGHNIISIYDTCTNTVHNVGFQHEKKPCWPITTLYDNVQIL